MWQNDKQITETTSKSGPCSVRVSTFYVFFEGGMGMGSGGGGDENFTHF